MTVYEVTPGGVTPLVERLICRDPARRLALSAATTKFGYLTGENVVMTVNSADEKGARLGARSPFDKLAAARV